MPTPTDPAEAIRPAPGRPKDPAKRAAILDAAQRLFLGQGFEGASMDQIASTAGVSKLTLYSHFGDKEALFVAAVEHHCAQQVPPALFAPDPGTPLRPRLLGIARALYALMTSTGAVDGFRVMCARTRQDARLPMLYWNAGTGRLQTEFAGLLARRTAAGDLVIEDTARAATQFFALLRGDLHPRLLMGCGESGGIDVDAHVEATVDLFLRGYLAEPGAPEGGQAAR